MYIYTLSFCIRKNQLQNDDVVVYEKEHLDASATEKEVWQANVLCMLVKNKVRSLNTVAVYRSPSH